LVIEGWRAAWRPKFQAVRAKQEALAAELAALYPDVANKLKELFGRLEEADREAREIDRSKPLDRRGIPTGDGRHFRPTAELAGATPAFLKELRLPAMFTRSALRPCSRKLCSPRISMTSARRVRCSMCPP